MIRDPVDSEINPLHQEDIVYYIFSYLLKKELLEVARVCTQWNLISSSCPQWKRIHLFTNESSREIFQIGQDYVTPQIIGRYSGENLFELTYEFDGTKLNDSNFLQIIQACKNIQTLRLLGNSIFDFSLCGPFVKPGKLMKTHQRNLGQAIHDFSPNIFNIYLANVRNLDIRGLMIVKVLEIVVWVESLMPQLESLKLGWVFESDDLHFFRPTWQFNLIHFHVNAIALSKAKKDLAPKQLQTFSMIGFSQGVNCELIKDFVAPCNLLANLNLCCSFYLFDEEEESYQFFQQLTLANNAISDVNLRATELNDRSLICIAENCPNLRRINIGCTQVTKNGVDKLLDFCTLSHLDLCYCQQITSLGNYLF